jgi:hypothetical protein
MLCSPSAGEDPERDARRWPVGEPRAALHQRAVGYGAVGDEDGRAGREQVECEHRAVPGLGGADDSLDAEVGSAEEEERGQ